MEGKEELSEEIFPPKPSLSTPTEFVGLQQSVTSPNRFRSAEWGKKQILHNLPERVIVVVDHKRGARPSASMSSA